MMNRDVVVAMLLAGVAQAVHAQCEVRALQDVVLTPGGARIVALDNETIAVPGSFTDVLRVVESVNGVWQETHTLRPADAQVDDGFGSGVGIDGDRMVIGAVRHRVSSRKNAGVAYVFDRIGGQWVESARLVASDRGRDQFFGNEVAVLGDRAVISSWGTEPGLYRGALYVFEFDGVSWIETAKILPDGLDDFDDFGSTVVLWPDRIIAGSLGDDDAGDGAGAFYIFDLIDGEWTQTDKLYPPDGASVGLGQPPVAFEEGRLVYSAFTADVPYAYYFEFDGQAWRTEIIFDPDPNDEISMLIPSLRGDTLIMGGLVDRSEPGSYRFERTDGVWQLAEQYDFNIGGINDALAVETLGSALFMRTWDLCADPCLSADWNLDGTIDTRDFLAFLADWVAGDGDFNEDGETNTLDVTSFLSAWVTGC